MRKKVYVMPAVELVGFAAEERALLMSSPLGGSNANAGNGNGGNKKGDDARSFVGGEYPNLFETPTQD